MARVGELHCDRIGAQLMMWSRWLDAQAGCIRRFDGDGLTHDELVDLRREGGNLLASCRRLRSLSVSIGNGEGQRGIGPRNLKRLKGGSIF